MMKSQQADGGGHLLISVSDTGVGVAPDQADQVMKETTLSASVAEDSGWQIPLKRA
jgi:hypothetical protein